MMFAIRVWQHRGERKLSAYIRQSHTDPSFELTASCATGYKSQLPLVRTGGTLNSERFIFVVLRLVALLFIRDF